MKKENLGNITILILIVITLLVWTVFPPQPYPDNNWGRSYPRQYAGEIIGSLVIVLMSCSLFLAARPKWAEPYFGGLDRMYGTHRRCSTSAFYLLFAHILTVPISYGKLPPGSYLALIAFPGIVIIVLVTIAPRIAFLNKLTGGSYNGWRKLHRLIGIFFILGYLHSLLVGALAAVSIQGKWLLLFFIFGTGSYLYTEILGRFLKKALPYKVETVNHHTNSTTEIVMRPINRAIPIPRAGQFLFVKFKAPGLDEPHPFTISSAPHEDRLRVTVKASGNFTRHLFSNLRAGMEAMIEGPYGMFDYKTGGPKQIWLAGGIGVTPFLSFIRDLEMSQLDRDVNFYYIVRHREEVVFMEEIKAATKNHPRLKTHIHFTSIQGPLTIETMVNNASSNLADHHVYMCCPLPMMIAFQKKFLEARLLAGNIHYEEFNFR